MNILTRGVKDARKEFDLRGVTFQEEDFGAYVRNYLFPEDKYVLIQKTPWCLQSREGPADDPDESDFEFQSSRGRKFYVAAKLRSKYVNDSIEWCRLCQFESYQEINQHMPVYVVIGVGLQSSHPEQLFFLPLTCINYAKLYRSALRPFEIPRKKCISEKQLI